jgi:hypothetical protein
MYPEINGTNHANQQYNRLRIGIGTCLHGVSCNSDCQECLNMINLLMFTPDNFSEGRIEEFVFYSEQDYLNITSVKPELTEGSANA